MVLSLKYFDAHEVERIEFNPSSTGIEPVTVTKQEDIAQLAAAFRETYPYAPNHESIRSPWYTTRIVFKSGQNIVFKLKRGNNAHPTAAWIEFDAKATSFYYQNLPLNRCIKALDLPLHWGKTVSSADVDPAIYFIVGVFALATFVLVQQIRHMVAASKGENSRIQTGNGEK